MPSSSAWRIVASEAASSCGPQLKAQPPPPMAHAPKPTLVISSPLVPRERVGNVMIFLCLGLSFKDDLAAHMAALTHFLRAAAVTLNAYCLHPFPLLRPQPSQPNSLTATTGGALPKTAPRIEADDSAG